MKDRGPRLPILLTLEALALFVVIDLCFWLSGFQKIYTALLGWGRRKPTRSELHSTHRLVADTGRAVRAATSLYYRKRLDCLPKALTLYVLLRRRGVPAELRLGVKKFPFAAHAWVEVDGLVIEDSPARVGRYTPLPQI